MSGESGSDYRKRLSWHGPAGYAGGMSQSSSICGFHHVALRVHDFDRSVAFYQNMLGMTRKIEWGQSPKRAIMLQMGEPSGGILEIFEQPDQPQGEQHPLLLHLCLRCSDVDGMIARLREQGVVVTMEPSTIQIDSRPTGPTPVHIAFFKGPDGEVVELFDSQAV